MRQTLIRIFLDEPWAVWKVDPATGYPGPGIAILLLVLCGGWMAIVGLRGGNPFNKEHRSSLVSWLAVLLLVSIVPMPAASFPIFSYGLMLLVGFLSALLLAQRRGLREGIKPELLFDMAFW